MKPKPTQGYTFDIARDPERAKRLARFTCAGCGLSTDVPVGTALPHLDLIKKRLERSGWEGSTTNRSHIRCPACK